MSALNAGEQEQKHWEQLKAIPSPWEGFVFLEPSNPDYRDFFIASAEKELLGFIECHPLHKEFFYDRAPKSDDKNSKIL